MGKRYRTPESEHSHCDRAYFIFMKSGRVTGLRFPRTQAHRLRDEALLTQSTCFEDVDESAHPPVLILWGCADLAEGTDASANRRSYRRDR